MKKQKDRILHFLLIFFLMVFQCLPLRAIEPPPDPEISDGSLQEEPDGQESEEPIEGSIPAPPQEQEEADREEADLEQEIEPIEKEAVFEGGSVKAIFDEGVMPEAVELRASWATGSQMQEAKERLAAQQVDFDGVLALDLSFWLDGEEIEPEQGSVQIQTWFDKTLIDPQMKEGSLQIHHLAKEDPEIEEVASEQNGIFDHGEQYSSEFEVDSFSMFTITWQIQQQVLAQIDVTYMSVDGQILDQKQNDLTITKTKQVVDLSAYVASLEDYSFVGIYSLDGYEFETITFSFEEPDYYDVILDTDPPRTYTYFDEEPVELDVYIVYEKTGSVQLSFDANGGDLAAPEPNIGVMGLSVPLPAYQGKRSGYQFLGWAKARNLTSGDYYEVYPPGTNYRLSERAETLYAVWNRTTSSTGTFYIRKDGTIPTEPSQYGAGAYTKGIQVPGAITRYHWTVDVDQDDLVIEGNHAINTVSQNLGALPTTEQIKAVYPEFNEEEQYILWYVQKYATPYWHVDGALLDRNKLNVTYDRNCDDERVQVPLGYQAIQNAKITVGNSGSIQGSPVVPQREGHVFLGWNTKKDGSGETYRSGDPYTLKENTTFYAQWQLNVHMLVIQKLTSGNMADPDQAFQFSVAIYDRNGNVFKRADDTLVPDENGVYSFTLKHRELHVFNVPEGGSYIVSEDPKEYSAAYRIGEGALQSGNSTQKQPLHALTEVVFTNTKVLPIPTGITKNGLGRTIIAGGIGMSWIGVIVFTNRRKKQEHEADE